MATAIVTLVIAVTKFAEGAWLVILLIPLLIGGFYAIHVHYKRLDGARRAETPLLPEEVVMRAVVPIADLGMPARQALAFARAVARDDAHVVAVHVTDDVAAAEQLRRQWEEWEPGVELILIESPFRSLAGPAAGVPRRGQRTEPARHAHGHPARVRPLELVGAPAPQPDRAAAQSRPAVPPGRRGGQRAVPHGQAKMTRSSVS